MSDARTTFHFKLVLLGNAGVGKSCLVLRFVRNEFYEDQETTIGGACIVGGREGGEGGRRGARVVAALLL